RPPRRPKFHGKIDDGRGYRVHVHVARTRTDNSEKELSHGKRAGTVADGPGCTDGATRATSTCAGTGKIIPPEIFNETLQPRVGLAYPFLFYHCSGLPHRSGAS